MAKRELITRSEFARLAGVSAASVTRACKGRLKLACFGKRIDMDHEKARKYVADKEKERTQVVPATGFDPKYEEAVEFCVRENRFSARAVQKGVHISWDRAKKIVVLMSAAGVIPEKNEPPPVVVRPPVVIPGPPIIKGHTKRNLTKKAAALEKLEAGGSEVFEVPNHIEKFADMTLRKLIGKFGSDCAFLDWLKATKTIEEIEEKRLKNAERKGTLVSRELVSRGVIEPIDTMFLRMLTDGAKTMARRVTSLHDSGASMEEVEASVIKKLTSFIRPVKKDIKKNLGDI